MGQYFLWHNHEKNLKTIGVLYGIYLSSTLKKTPNSVSRKIMDLYELKVFRLEHPNDN